MGSIYINSPSRPDWRVFFAGHKERVVLVGKGACKVCWHIAMRKPCISTNDANFVTAHDNSEEVGTKCSLDDTHNDDKSSTYDLNIYIYAIFLADLLSFIIQVVRSKYKAASSQRTRCCRWKSSGLLLGRLMISASDRRTST